jgi:ubiquinone biosynthesis protein UbiJ
MKDASNNSGDMQQHRSKTSRQALQEALMERERFLEKHLHLRAYQAEIDRVLDKSGNCQGRMDVLGTLIQGKLIEMQKELFKLTTILQKSVPSN